MKIQNIYIPVWIDQKPASTKKLDTFTSIYIPVWIDQKQELLDLIASDEENLYSSMDRLETRNESIQESILIEFIFQYGQIRNTIKSKFMIQGTGIYIPVWIDQKH